MAQAPKGSEEQAVPALRRLFPYRVLARKYRPVDFTTLIGQDAMVRTHCATPSRRAASRMPSCSPGVRGVGKTTTARIIARALNCVGPGRQGRRDSRSLRRLRPTARPSPKTAMST